MSMSNPPNQAVDTLLTALDEIDLGIVLLIAICERNSSIARFCISIGLLTNQEFPTAILKIDAICRSEEAGLSSVRIQFLH